VILILLIQIKMTPLFCAEMNSGCGIVWVGDYAGFLYKICCCSGKVISCLDCTHIVTSGNKAKRKQNSAGGNIEEQEGEDGNDADEEEEEEELSALSIFASPVLSPCGTMVSPYYHHTITILTPYYFHTVLSPCGTMVSSGFNFSSN